MKLRDLKLNRTTGNARGTCPECSEHRKIEHRKEKCLSVHMPTGQYHCHNCGTTGLLDEFKTRPEPMQETYTPPPQDTVKLSGEAYEYLRSRGLTLEVLHANNVTSSGKGWIQFNYMENGVIVNIKYRHPKEKKFYQSPNGKPIFYGQIEGPTLVICEGEIDKLSFEVAGVNAVSVPAGAPNEGDASADGKLKCLAFAEAELSQIQDVVIAADNDPNGRRLSEELIRRIGPERCRRVDWPEGCKDGNDVLMNHGIERLARLVKDAKPMPLEGVSLIADFRDEVFDFYENGYPEGMPVGYPEFDMHFKFQPGYLVTVTGIPAHGKSNFVEQMAVKLAGRHGIKFGIFSPEHFPAAYFVQRLARVYIGKGMFGSGRMNPIELDNALKFLNKHFFIIHANEEHTLDNILHVAKQLVYREGIKGLIIDPWTDVEHDIERGENETRYIAKALAKIKQFNRLHRVTTFVVAHPTKMQKKEDGTYQVPKLYDISGSANFFNKTDFGLTVYREADDTVTVHVQKVKFQDILGRCGAVQFNFDRVSSRYIEPGQIPWNVEHLNGKLIKLEIEDDEGVPF